MLTRSRAAIVMIAACLLASVLTASPVSAAVPTSCTVVDTGTGFDVSWDQTAADAVIVYRSVDGGAASWRGRVDAPGLTFGDGGLPNGAVSVTYEIKHQVGSVNGTSIPCTESPTEFACVWFEAESEYRIGWASHPDGVKYVVKRTVDGTGPHWRAAVLSPGITFTDSVVTGDVTYKVEVKDAGEVVVDEADCLDAPGLSVRESEEVVGTGVLPLSMEEFADLGVTSSDEDSGEAQYEDGQGVFEPFDSSSPQGSLLVAEGNVASPQGSLTDGRVAFAVGDPSGDVFQLHDGSRVDTGFRHWHPMMFPILTGYNVPWKFQIEVYRSDQVVGEDLPYFKRTTPPQTALGGELRTAPHSFQAGFSYTWRYRTWQDGDFGTATSWVTGEAFSIDQASNLPGAPYPVSPFGAIGADDVILRLQASEASQSQSSKPITEYRFEIRPADFRAAQDTVIWTETIPASQTANTFFGTVLQVAVPNVLVEDERYRWRAYAVDADGDESSPSRWRYFRTMGQVFQDENWFVPSRSGSYQAGDTGDEVSGLVASQTYPGIYWMIRDNGPGDRARLYAIKIDPVSGLLQNIDGYVTKEFDVVTAGNADLDGDGSPGVSNIDWEALTLDPSGRLWVADSGSYWDGQSQTRAYGQFFRIPEPDPYATSSFTATVDNVYRYAFPDGNFRNVEGLFSVGHHKFLIKKEGGHSVWRLPRYPSPTGINMLDYQGTLEGTIGNVTGAEMSLDRSRFGVTTSPLAAHFWDLPASNLDLTTITSTQAEVLVAPILANGPDSYYYYRSAALLDEQGLLQQSRGGLPAVTRQTNMQTEGLAFPIDGSGSAAMVSEYGRHVMYVAPSAYEALQGEPGDNANGANLPAVGTLTQPDVQDMVLGGQISLAEAEPIDAVMNALASAQDIDDLLGLVYNGSRPEILSDLIEKGQQSGALSGPVALLVSPSVFTDLMKLFAGDVYAALRDFYQPLHLAVQLDLQARAVGTFSCAAPWLELERNVNPGSGRLDLRRTLAPSTVANPAFNYPAQAIYSIGEVKYNTGFSMSAAIVQLNKYYTTSGLTHVDVGAEDIAGGGSAPCWDLSTTARRPFAAVPVFYAQVPAPGAAVLAGALPSGTLQGRVGYWIDRNWLLASIATLAAWLEIKEQEIDPVIAQRVGQAQLAFDSLIATESYDAGNFLTNTAATIADYDLPQPVVNDAEIANLAAVIGAIGIFGIIALTWPTIAQQ